MPCIRVTDFRGDAGRTRSTVSGVARAGSYALDVDGPA
jgi:hypothetical protein